MKAYKSAAISGGKMVQLASNLAVGIPLKADALFWLDGLISGNQLLDKSGNGRHFTITNKDFPTDWLAGVPFKSLATISAPAGDAILIAADVNSFLYTAGTPNQIPVISLFQDVDYEHKLFCRHYAQVVDANGVEIQEPRVFDIVLYNTIKSSVDLDSCVSYFGVPTEDTSTSVWLSPSGSDTTGAGTKANPYRSLDKIKATTKANVYCKTGSYDPAASFTFSAGTLLTIIATGRSSFNLLAKSITVNRHIAIKRFSMTGTATYPILISTSINFESCNVTRSGGKWAVSQAGMTDAKFKYCNFSHTGIYSIVADYVALNNVIIDTCFGTMCLDVLATNRIKGLELYNSNFINSSISAYVDTNYVVKGNKIVNASTKCIDVRATINRNVTSAICKYNHFESSMSSLVIVRFGGSNEQTANAINNQQFIGNYVKNNYVGGGSCHSVLICGGINPTIKYNKIISTNGYGLVLKSSGVHYTTTDAHVSYNVFQHAGDVINAIYGRGVWGAIVANNSFINQTYGNVIMLDDDTGYGFDNSILAINNIIYVSGNMTSLFSGANITSRKNSINRNGFTVGSIGANNQETSVVIDANGIPASKIEFTESIAGDNATGLASTYVVPNAITYQNQGGTWQSGAVILP